MVAVEAQGGFLPFIRLNATANGVSDRVSVVHGLVGSGIGVLADPGRRATASHWEGEPPTLSMDDVLHAGGGRADIIKIDVEGAEFALLGDGAGWLERVDRIVMEVHPQFGDVPALVHVLEASSFLVSLTNDRLLPVGELRGPSGYVFARRS